MAYNDVENKASRSLQLLEKVPQKMLGNFASYCCRPRILLYQSACIFVEDGKAWFIPEKRQRTLYQVRRSSRVEKACM
jgi:hypothetical protein